jgi:hypothetical protein
MTNHLYYGDNLTVLRDRTRFPDGLNYASFAIGSGTTFDCE